MENKIFQPKNKEDLINPAVLKREIPELNTEYFKSIGSTQDEAKKCAENLSNEKLLVIAERQTKGRGRFNRGWVSPSGGIWMSLVVYPEIQPQKSIQMSLVTGISLCKIIKKLYGLTPQLKWPNDIMIEGKKVGGILIEAALSSGKIKWVVVGIGVDVNNTLPKKLLINSASVADFTKRKINRTFLAVEIIKELLCNYERFVQKGFEQFRKYFSSKDFLLNKFLTIEQGGETQKGKALGINDDGFLILEKKGRMKIKITGGTVLSND